MKQNFFRLLDLPEQYDLDPAALDRQYRLLSQRVHPDRQAHSGDAAHRARLLAESALLNDAYQTLKQPDKRALHLLVCWMGPTVEATHTPSVDPAFLADMLAWQENIHPLALDARLQPEATSAMQKRLNDTMAEQHNRIRSFFSAFTTDPEGYTRSILGELAKLRYYRRMLDTLHRIEEGP